MWRGYKIEREKKKLKDRSFKEGFSAGKSSNIKEAKKSTANNNRSKPLPYDVCEVCGCNEEAEVFLYNKHVCLKHG